MPAMPMPEYALTGPQVEPEASYWNRCPVPCLISLAELIAVTDDPNNPRYFRPYPQDKAVIKDEFNELLELENLRNDPAQVVSTVPGRTRCPISLFLQIRPQPLGAVINTARGEGFPVIATGSELARYFENETPGLAHRHALNLLIRDTGWSPPRQAWVWSVVDATIASALQAAWYYKWLSSRPNVSRRPRPVEHGKLDVLYDRFVNSTGSDSNGLRTMPRPSPGTPRHPAYPSGHSTYGGAASEILSFFFPDYRAEFDRLADNAGIARLWAGIHWRSDHVEGIRLGRTVACLMIDQIRRSGIPLVPARRPDNEVPPTRDVLETQADKFADKCGKATPAMTPGFVCPPTTPCVQPGAGADKAKKEPSDTRGQSFVG